MNAYPREDIVAALPMARRYARALGGTQQIGDSLVARTLQQGLPDAPSARLALYGGISRAATADRPASHSPAADSQRQMLVLTALEGLTVEEAARALQLDPEVAGQALERARTAMRTMSSADVLIIEDEPIIAMDLELLVRQCGHRVIGVAASETEAVRIARETRPGLVLADVNLGQGGDGTRAVARIIEALRDTDLPVIFVTAYPERLLTGAAIEPAFVVTKPFDPLALAVTTFQAVCGHVPLEHLPVSSASDA
jgi:CheY-like chemotaxis protein